METYRMETYRATIHEPNRPDPKPDKYGTLTIPGNKVDYAMFPGPLRKWAAELLPKCTPGAYCEIHRIEEVLLETITQEDVK